MKIQEKTCRCHFNCDFVINPLSLGPKSQHFKKKSIGNYTKWQLMKMAPGFRDFCGFIHLHERKAQLNWYFLKERLNIFKWLRTEILNSLSAVTQLCDSRLCDWRPWLGNSCYKVKKAQFKQGFLFYFITLFFSNKGRFWIKVAKQRLEQELPPPVLTQVSFTSGLGSQFVRLGRKDRPLTGLTWL